LFFVCINIIDNPLSNDKYENIFGILTKQKTNIFYFNGIADKIYTLLIHRYRWQ